jgi:Zn-dependent M28 family amino/carboxypeptidase
MRMVKLRIFIILLVVASLFPVRFISARQEKDAILSTVDQIQEEFTNVPCRAKDRQAGVRALFEKAGAPKDAMAVEKFGSVENLVLRQAGTSTDTIVIGAHYDFVERGCGAVDNWSGIVTVAHLYRTIRLLAVQKTVAFVAFGKEEEGLLGSKAMVRAIPKDELPRYCAMINIDSFGIARPFAMKNTSSPGLMELAEETAGTLKIPFYTVPINNADADSSSFIARKIPAVTLSGLADGWQLILHTANDQASKVNSGSVYLGYRLALGMWSAIDKAPCDMYR